MSSARQSLRLVWLILIASLAFNAGVGVAFGVLTFRKYATPSERGQRRDGPGRLQSLDRLNLTPDQEVTTASAREEMTGRVHELRQGLKDEHAVLTDLMTAPELDREAIATQLSTIASSRERVDRCVVEHFLRIKELLEPDQQEAFNEMIRRAFSCGGPGRGGFGGLRGHHKGPGRGRRGTFRGRDD